MDQDASLKNKLLCSFLSIYRSYHDPKNPNIRKDKEFIQTEKIFLGLFGLGLLETFSFLFNECYSDEHFQEWIIDRKGKATYDQAVLSFTKWYNHTQNQTPDKEPLNALPLNDYLSLEQHRFWEENGYLKVEGVINGQQCDSVVEIICEELNIDLDNKDTWNNNNEKLQGIMFQVFQHDAISAIRNDQSIKAIFSDLYKTNSLIPNVDKLGYNPPLKEGINFKGSPLHWDFDMENGPDYYIQGLVYLNDVPENRGAFTLVPGFHHQLEPFLQQYNDVEKAIDFLRKEKKEIAVAGKKGDLILWLEALPHAASPNYSDSPRFVQYISFSKLH